MKSANEKRTAEMKIKQKENVKQRWKRKKEKGKKTSKKKI